jgi:Icc-related predicted phosphoesterase
VKWLICLCLISCGSRDSLPVEPISDPIEITPPSPVALPSVFPTVSFTATPTEVPTLEPTSTPIPTTTPFPETPTTEPITPTPTAAPTIQPTINATPISIKLMVASDIQEGNWSKTVRFEKTAQVIEKEKPDYVIAAGDLSNAKGTVADYQQLDKAWGRFKSIILPIPGNHDQVTDINNFYNYFAYMNYKGKGYFTKDIGAWTVIGLNYEFTSAHVFKAGDAQMVWLDSVLKNKPKGRPVLVFSHPPRYTRGDSGGYENAGKVSVVWDILLKYAPDVKIYIAGHVNGVYERWQVMDNNKKASVTGIRSFTVATGGTSSYKAGVAGDLLESTANVYGAMKLILRSNGYDWEYKPTEGYNFQDVGSFNF